MKSTIDILSKEASKTLMLLDEKVSIPVSNSFTEGTLNKLGHPTGNATLISFNIKPILLGVIISLNFLAFGNVYLNYNKAQRDNYIEALADEYTIYEQGDYLTFQE